jgi:hypothetical protein
MFIISTLIATSLLTADVNIEDVLPANTIAFASVTDVSELVTHLQKMGICDAVCDIAQTVCNSLDLMGDEECPIAASYFSKDGTCTIPSGQASWGLYPVVDFESGTVGIGMLAMLEMDDEKFSAMMKEAFEGHAKANDSELETVDIIGRDVWTVQYEIELPADLLPIPIDFGGPSSLYFANTDGYLLFGTEPDGLSSLFSAIDGDPIEDSLASSSVYDALMARCGTEADLKAGVLLTNLADTLMQMDTSGMMVMPSLKTAFGDIDGAVETLSFSPSEDVMLEAKCALLMEEGRNGLLGLVAADAPATAIPSFVGDDTITYSQNNIAFDKVVPLMKEVVASNPMFAMQMNPQMMEQMEAGISMYTSTLGSETHFMTTGTEPYTADTVGFMAAVECVDEEALSNVLSLMMPSFGAAPSDFLGNQIFTIDLGAGMMMPLDLSFSIAVGGGYVFVGSQYSVENALRAIANPKEAKSTHGSNAAVPMLEKDNVSGWGYGDMAKSMMMQKAMSDSLVGMKEDVLVQIEEFDPEMAAEMRAETEKNMAIQNAMLDAMAKLFGPMAWSLHADDTGFTAEVIMLQATK